MGLNDNDWPERPERDPEAYTEEEIEKLLETAEGTFRGLQRIDDKKKHDRLLLWALLRAARRRIVYLTRREALGMEGTRQGRSQFEGEGLQARRASR